MTEKQLTSAIIEYLNYTGRIFCWKINSGAIKAETNGKQRLIRMAKAGTSDIQGILKGYGRMVCLEIKLPKTRHTVTQLQREYLEKMKSYGAVVGVATSPEEALEIIKGEK